MSVQASFWHGKRVLVTGHSGFKGGWLCLWLQRMGAQVAGVSLAPQTTPNLFDAARIAQNMRSHFCDVRDAAKFAALVRDFAPEVVFHLAAQPLVRASYREPVDTFSTNVMGTVHVLQALRDVPAVRVAVMVTTDKVYRNTEQGVPFGEDDPLGGFDPYSASKAASELVISSYRDAFLRAQGVAVASARAGNVIGGGDWSEDRLIPDAVRAWQQDGGVLDIRNPHAVRPWQHVLEPLSGYLTLAQALWLQPELAGAFNFGPPLSEAITVGELVQLARNALGYGELRLADTAPSVHEAATLVLNNTKAGLQLGVHPQWSLAETIARTMHWYRLHAQGADARALCDADILAYEASK